MSYYELTPRIKPGPETYEDVKGLFVDHIEKDSIVFTDTCKTYKTVKKEHPELIAHLRQVSHSKLNRY